MENSARTYSPVSYTHLNLKEGDIAQENIVAPRRIVDTRMTEALREQAESLTAPIYDYISSAKTSAIDNVNNFFNDIISISPDSFDESMVSAYNDIYGLSLTYEEYSSLISLGGWSKAQLRDNIVDVYKRQAESLRKKGESEAGNGGVAQLGEHLPCKQGVRSSNLLISTK